MEVYICEQETPRIEFSREKNKFFDFCDHPNSSSAKIQGGRVGSAAEGTGHVGYVQCRAQVGLGSGTAIQTSLMKLESCNACLVRQFSQQGFVGWYNCTVEQDSARSRIFVEKKVRLL